MNEPWRAPQLRASCRHQLIRELLLRMLIHDVRNPLTPISGSLELLELQGAKLPDYLVHSLDQLVECLRVYSAHSWDDAAHEVSGEALRVVLGDIVTGGHHPLPVGVMRLVSAMELAAPRGIAIQSDADGGWELRVSGLSEEAIALAVTPRYASVAPRIAAPDPVLGACLLRVVAGEAGGQVRRRGDASDAALVMLLPG